jgi:hypothetical protein
MRTDAAFVDSYRRFLKFLDVEVAIGTQQYATPRQMRLLRHAKQVRNSAALRERAAASGEEEHGEEPHAGT